MPRDVIGHEVNGGIANGLNAQHACELAVRGATTNIDELETSALGEDIAASKLAAIGKWRRRVGLNELAKRILYVLHLRRCWRFV